MERAGPPDWPVFGSACSRSSSPKRLALALAQVLSARIVKNVRVWPSYTDRTMAVADMNASGGSEPAVEAACLAELDIRGGGITAAPAVARRTVRDRSARRLAARAVARTACVLIATVIGSV